MTLTAFISKRNELIGHLSEELQDAIESLVCSELDAQATDEDYLLKLEEVASI